MRGGGHGGLRGSEGDSVSPSVQSRALNGDAACLPGIWGNRTDPYV